MTDYWKKKLKELEEDENKTPQYKTTKPSNSSDYWQNKISELDETNRKKQEAALTKTEDIAPVQEDERSWFQKGVFEDGYQFGDISKVILGTTTDLLANVGGGVLEIGESAVDAGVYLVGGMADLLGADDSADILKDFVKKDLYDGEKVAANTAGLVPKAVLGLMGENDYDDVSVLGEKTDSLAQSGGQLLGTMALQAAGVPWFLTSGVTSFGGEVENAFNQGANYAEAGISGAVTAGAEMLTEKLFGGSGLGEKGLINLDGLTKGVSNKVVKALLDFGIDMTAEGSEEVVSQVMSNLGSALYREENLADILFSEEAVDGYIESFVGGMALGGFANVGKTASSIKTGRDYRTGLNSNEQKVVDKVYEDRIVEAEKDGKKLNAKEKNTIYNEVMEDLEKGGISTEDIEKALGVESYKTYKEALDSEEALKKEFEELRNMKSGDMTDIQNERLAELKGMNLADTSKSKALFKQYEEEIFGLVKGSKLAESYNERARRGQLFEADVSRYDEKQKAVVQKAIDSGILNNTRRTHEFVDMVAKLSADKGVSFDFTNNEKLKNSSYALDGKIVNGYYDRKNKTVGLNINSRKALNTVVGHEITHVLEGTELYSELQKAAFEYSKIKGDYDSRRKALESLYKAEDVDSELTADLIGDYLFEDADFVKNLSTKNRNLFQKIYDEIKYLYKIATAGSREKRQLENVKRAFEQAYKESGKTTEKSGDVQYSLSEEARKADSDYLNAVNKGDTETAQKMVDEAAKSAGYNYRGVHRAKTDFTVFDRNKIGSGAGLQFGDGFYISLDIKDKATADYADSAYGKVKMDLFVKMQFPLELGKPISKETVAKMAKDLMWFGDDASVKYGVMPETVQKQLTSGDSYEQMEAIRWLAQENGKKISELLKEYGFDGIISENEYVTQAVVWDENQLKSANSVAYDDNGNVIPLSERFKSESNDIRYSLTDSDGKQLTKGQQEYFKDSKMRDENGNLKVMYHGSQNAGFHTFDAKFSDDGTSFFFVDRNDVAASYSGTSETYEAQTIRTAEDMNRFIESIGAEGYEVIERDGKFTLLYEGERVADSNTAQGIYKEFCWYEGVGEGDANYKVYLNLKNPLIVDAEDRNWNNISREFSQEVYDRYKSLTDSEKTALAEIAGWDEYGIFKDEILSMARAKANGKYYDTDLASAYEKLGGANANLYDAFSIAQENFSEESLREFAVKQMNTRDYAQKAKAEGYDGVIFKNVHDNGGYSNGSEGASTVAVAFDSNQIKSVANEKPTADKDIRYSLSEDSERRQLSEEQKKYFNGSKVVDENGNLKAVYHGSPSDFNEFSLKYLGTNGTAEGYGFYFTDSKRIAEGYSKGREGQQNGNTGKLFEVYLDIKKPLSDTEVTMPRSQFRKLLIELNNQVDADGEPLEFLANYGDVEWEGLNKVLNYAMEIEYDGSDSDVNMIHSVINACGDKELVFDLLRKVAGYDGIIVNEATWGGNQTIYIAFHPEQIKNVDNFNPTDNPDIRKSLSAENEQQTRKRGNVYGEDIAFNAPVKESVPETISEEAEAPVGVPITEEEAEEMREENFASLDDADAPLEREPFDYGERQAVTINNDSLKQITDNVSRILSLDANDTERMAETIRKYAENSDMTDIDLINELRQDFKYTEEITDFDDTLADAKRHMKGTHIYVPENLKGDFDGKSKDGFNAFRKEHFGHFYLTTNQNANAIGIDQAYQELREMFPEHFPEDLWNPADQLQKMGEVASSTSGTFASMDYDDATLQEVSEIIKSGINQYSQEEGLRIAEEARNSYFDNSDDFAPAKEGFAPVKEQYEAIRPKKSAEPKLIRVKDENARPIKKQRKWVGTSTDSEAVDGKILPEDLNQDTIHYQPISNKKTLGNANAKLNGMGYESSVAYFNSQFANKSVSLDDVALGERLIQEAIKRGDTKTAGELIQNVAILGTELGQKVQALSIIKRLTPEGQLGMLRKTVERGKTKGDKAYEGVEITQDMIDHILKTYGKDGTYDQKALNEAVEDVKQKIADQMKVTKMDKVNAWRYLSMLGNPKTHIRNLVSNVAMRGTVAVKNAVARTIEGIAPVKERTRTWKRATDDVKKFAQTTTMEMQGEIQDGGKYSEDASIKEKRATFKSKILNGVYEFNSNLLSKEDWWFSKSAFSNSLSEYLTANGILTAEDIKNNPKIVEKAKQYALEQSQIATFRQYSWLANKINEIERKNTATSIAVGAVLPFKKTPINIAKTALNYSPLGFVKTLTYDATQVKKGDMEASRMIDNLAQNITGSALTLVGYMLAQTGFLNGGGEDDKEGEYDYQLGEQAYSVNIGGATFSLSWLSPIAMPLFVGANAYEQLVEGKEWNGDVVIKTLAQTLDPLSEMSFLSSLDDVLSSYDSGVEKFAGIGQSMAQNYITQFAPTLMSQVAQVMDDTKRSTKVAADSEFKFVDETINKLKYKIPVLRATLEPSTDIWGNEVKQTEDILTRAFETFLAPYSKKDNIASAVDEEIKDLFKQTGDAGLIPSIPDNYINYDGTKYEMSSKDFTEYKKAYGQTAYDLMEKLFDTDTYQNATSEERADMVNRVYDYARDNAKKEYFAGIDLDFTNAEKDGEEYYKVNSIVGAIEADLPVDEYEFSVEYPEKYKFFKDNDLYQSYKAADEEGKRAYNWAFDNPGKYTMSKAFSDDFRTFYGYRNTASDIKGVDEDGDGRTDSGTKKANVIDWINGLDELDYGQKIILYRSMYNSKQDRADYNKDIIDYLNSREDISFEEMKTILTELGFRVDSKGHITWD